MSGQGKTGSAQEGPPHLITLHCEGFMIFPKLKVSSAQLVLQQLLLGTILNGGRHILSHRYNYLTKEL